MGITHREYLDNIYELMFTPFDFFNREDITISVRQAVFTVVWVSIFNIIGQAIADKTIYSSFWFVLTLIFNSVFILIAWFLTGLFFEYIAKIYGKECGLNKILFYTSFCAIPYIFFAPLNVLKQSGSFTIGAIAQMLLYFWIIFLYILAVKKSYNISIARSFMLIFLPFVGTIFAISWAIGFFVKMGYINSI